MVRTIDTLVGKMSMLRVASEISIYVTLWSTVTGVQGSDLCSVWPSSLWSFSQPAFARQAVTPIRPCMHLQLSPRLHKPTNQPTNQTNGADRPRARGVTWASQPYVLRWGEASCGASARRVSRAPLPRLWGDDWQWQLTGGVHKSPRRCTVSRTAVLFARTRACVRSPPDTPRPPRTSGLGRANWVPKFVESNHKVWKKKPWRLIALLMSHMYSWE